MIEDGIKAQESWLARRVGESARALARRTADAAASTPALRKPAVLRIWLLSAWRAQIAAAVAAILLIAVLPPVYRTALEWIYPPQAAGGVRVFGKTIGGKTAADPRVGSRQLVLLALSWLGAGGVVALLFWLHVPAAATQASSLARKREEEGDSLLTTQPSRSVLLYSTALSLATDPAHESTLREKVTKLDRQFSASMPGPKAAAPAEATAFDPVQAPIPLPSGQTLAGMTGMRLGPGSRYHVEGELGRGGMGVVFRAKDAVLDRDVALKELPARLAEDPAFAERFRHEARTLARLSHPNIVQVFDLVEDAGRLWMAMELMEGGDLDARLRASPRLGVRESVRLAVPLAEALAFAHSKGIVHRDMKPMNVLFTTSGIPKVTDFGLARNVDATMHTVEGTVLGSPRYMSPEQAAGSRADHRADVYSFGVVLYQMLTGTMPFEGDTASLLAQHITRPPPSPRTAAPDLPEPLEALLLRMLAKDPGARVQDMTEVAKALNPFLGA